MVDKKLIAQIMLVLTCVIGLVSIILAITAYEKWKTNADEFHSVLDNWKVTPVINMTAIAISASCPTGWEQLSFGATTYQEAMCNKGDGTLLPYFCSTNYLFAENATDEWVTKSGDYSNYIWKSKKICILRGGVNAIDRPLESESGYQSCGTNGVTGEYFFNSDLPCPLTYISNVPPTGSYVTIPLDASHNFYTSNAASVGRPYLQFNAGEGTPCRQNLLSNNGVRTQGDVDGLNRTGAAFSVAITGGTDNPFRTSHPSVGNCKDTDPRFVQIDTRTEELLLSENSQQNGGSIPTSDYVFASDSNSVNVSSYNRPEISWKKDCPYTRSEVDGVSGIIKGVTGATLALMVISIIAALFDCAIEGWAYKNATDNDDSNDEVANIYGKWGNIACTLGTLITTVVTFVIITRGKAFFRAMKEAECSDSTTNDAIGYLADTAVELFDIFAGKLTLDCLKIVWYIYSLLKSYGYIGGDDDDKNDDVAMN